LASYWYWGVPAAVIGAAGATVWTMLAPRCTWWGDVVPSGTGGSSQIALTFDDGSTPGGTARVLDVLGELGVPVAFFVGGRNVRRWPELVRRMDREGHLVANHSFDHSRVGFFRGPWYWRRQIAETDAAIEAAIGRRPAMFRPPMGMKSNFIIGAARDAGQAVITWSHRGMDGVQTTPERICERLGPAARGGDILILHDGVEPNGHRDASATVAALKPLVSAIRDRGLRFVRLDELIGRPGYAEARAGQAVIVESMR